MTQVQLKYLRHGMIKSFEPTGAGWRVCDALVADGLMEHNGAARFCGERYTTTPAGAERLKEWQIHECPCGNRKHGAGKCEQCGAVMFPMWDVMLSDGRIVGNQVAGSDLRDALESARQNTQFDGYSAFTCREAIE